MDSFLISYIYQRMAEKGFESFHFEPVSVLTTANVAEYRIKAYNEYFFLISKGLTDGTIIRSDTNQYIVNSFYPGQSLNQVQEFTGLVIIENPANSIQLIEFIRVYPK